MTRYNSLYIAASTFSSLSIGLGIGLCLTSSFFSFVILSFAKQLLILALLALLFGASTYALLFWKKNGVDLQFKSHIFLYWFSAVILLVSFFVNYYHQSETLRFWSRAPLKNMQSKGINAYQANTGYSALYTQIGSGMSARVLENAVPLPGKTENCLSMDTDKIGRGNVCFWENHVVFAASDKTDPRVNSRLYEILYPILYVHIHIYILTFLSVGFGIVNGFLLANKKSKEKFFVLAFVAGYPFIYLYPYVFSLNHSYISIGNDFRILYYGYKVYLLDFLSRMEIPLWSPSESAGFPFYSSPFTQTFYPFNIILALYYRITGGYTELDHQRFTVFGISLFSLGLFLWLRRMKGVNLRASLFGALVMGTSFKVTEILRFPNAIHTAAWLPWILFAITGVFQSTTPRQAWRYGLLLFFSLICLLTGGYPYYVFYSIFLFIPYILLFFIQTIRKAMLNIHLLDLKRAFTVLLTTSSAALAVCTPYLLKMASLLHQTTDRSGNNYAYSTAELFNFTDTLGSLFFPPAAQLEGLYYFGAIGILLIIFYIFDGANGIHSISLESNEIEKKDPANQGVVWLKVFFLIWIGCISYITYGRESRLFYFLWHSMPLFSSLRTWGRMNIILVPIFAWLLALAYQYFETVSFTPSLLTNGRTLRLKSTSYLTLIFSLVFATQTILILKKDFDEYWISYVAPLNMFFIWGNYFKEQTLSTWFFQPLSETYSKMPVENALIYIGLLFMLLTLLAFLILTFFFLYFHKKPKSEINMQIMWGVLCIFSLINMGFAGPWLWTRGTLDIETKYNLNIEKKNMESFSQNRTLAYGSITSTNKFNTGYMYNWYFERYISFLKDQKSDTSALEQLLGVTDGQKIYFSEKINYSSARDFLQDAERFQNFEQVISYTGDNLVISAHVSKAGYLSFIDNWDADWTAAIDGAPTSIHLLLGTFKSIYLESGEHQIVFKYSPFSINKILNFK